MKKRLPFWTENETKYSRLSPLKLKYLQDDNDRTGSPLLSADETGNPWAIIRFHHYSEKEFNRIRTRKSQIMKKAHEKIRANIISR